MLITKKVLLVMTNIVAKAINDRISSNAGNSVSRVQKNSAYHTSVIRYPKPASIQAHIPCFLTNTQPCIHVSAITNPQRA